MSNAFLHAWLLLKRLGIVLLIYELLRIIFLLFNAPLFEVNAGKWMRIMLCGLRFDISAIMYTNLLLIILHVFPVPQRNSNGYQKLIKGVFYLSNLPFLFLSVVDIGYFPYSLKRSTADIVGFSFDFMRLLEDILVDFWYLLLVALFLIALMEFLYRKTSVLRMPPRRSGIVAHVCVTVAAGAAAVTGARGGLQLRPLSPISALQCTDAEYAPLVLNTPFYFLYSLTQPGVKPVQYFSRDTLQQRFTFCRSAESDAPVVCTLPAGRKNVNIVIIVLESFSQEFIGVYGANPSYTPFLDSLGREGLVFGNMFANGTRSVEGIPAICASVPVLMDECFIYSRFQVNTVEGLAGLLKKIGYVSAFFHGGTNGTFNFDSFSRLAGFDSYYGRKEYNNEKDFDGSWGIFDGPFFQFAAQKMQTMQQPFCCLLFSLSSHHPYSIPPDFAQQVSDVGDPFLKSLRYTDYALKEFFRTAASMPWYSHTLFIITADHRGPAFDAYYNTPTGRYAIPLIVYLPGSDLLGATDIPVQQIDILPGIMDFVGYPYPFCSLGESFFRDLPFRYVYQYLNGIAQITDGKYVLHFDGSRSIGLYAYSKRQPPGNNLLDSLPEERQRLEERLKAVLQIYYTAMQTNQLSYDRLQTER
ncbi:MAG: sulfatase [Chitinophagales bacterium]|nr:MAG: sulfatase [Chitinophagales bacterium]